MPELRGATATLLRCRTCGSPVSRDAAKCAHCGTVDPIAAEEAAKVQGAVATADRDFNQARHDFELALQTTRSWQWKLEAYGVPFAILTFGLLMAALAVPLGRINPLAWFAISAGLPFATTWLLFRISAPSVNERYRAFLLMREQAFRCTACGRPARALPTATGTVSCEYCGATLNAVPAEEFVRAATQARSIASTAERARRDAEFRQWLRTMGDDSTSLVQAVLVITGVLLVVSVGLAALGKAERPPLDTSHPEIAPLASIAACTHCIPTARDPAQTSLGQALAVIRADKDAEGLVVFASHGAYHQPEECAPVDATFLGAQWSTPVSVSPEEAMAFFRDTYGWRATNWLGIPGIRANARHARIRGASQNWDVYVKPCWWGAWVAAVPDQGWSFAAVALLPAAAFGLLAFAGMKRYL